MIQNSKDKAKQQKLHQPPKTFVVSATKDCLQVDKNRVNFCKYPIFASSFKQNTINIELLDVFAQQQKKQFYMLKIFTQVTTKIEATNIFTFKLVENGEESTQMQVPIKPGESMQIHIRVNIPEIQASMDIAGSITLKIENYMPMTLNITSRGQVPQIICLKQMVNKKTGFRIIKIPSKSVMKIPFKNCSNINFCFEIKLLSKDLDNLDSDGVKMRIQDGQPKKFDESKQKSKQSFIIKVDANSPFYITIEFELLKKDQTIRIARRVLLLQVQGTKLFFPFPLQVIICE